MKEIKNIENIFKDKINNENRWDFYHFWSKVDIKDNIEECWDWTNSTLGTGYGRYWYPSKNKMELAHRVAYMLSKGTIPDKLQVQHICNNRKCCNPYHLELGDNSKNQRYLIKCGRRNNNGEGSSFSILTSDQVRDIHRLHKKNPVLRNWQIAEIFKVNQSTVSRIISGETWPHIYEEFYQKNV